MLCLLRTEIRGQKNVQTKKFAKKQKTYGCIVTVSSNYTVVNLTLNYIFGTFNYKMYNFSNKTTIKMKQYSGKIYNKCNHKLKRPAHIKVI